jgi:hypothetical protein
MRTLWMTILMTAAGVLAQQGTARADMLTITFLDAEPEGLQGETVSFIGTITAASSNTGDVYLNADALNLNGLFTLDDTPFFLNAPLFMAPAQIYTGVLFTVMVNKAAPLGTYSGVFSILGGDQVDPGALNQISNSAAFAVNVVPEPASLLLLGSGLIAWAATRRAGASAKRD